MKQNIFRLISLIVSLIIGTVMAFAQTYVYELVTLDEVKLGGEFIVATSNDLKAEGTYVMNGIGGTDKNGIISGSLSKELVSYHKLKITPKSSGTYFDLNIDGTNIFRLENNLCWKNYSGYNKEWLLEDGLNSNTIVIKMKKPETRFLAFSDGVTGFKLYTEGYGVSELYFFKEVEYHEPEQTMGNITMSDAGFSTYYVDHTFIMPEGLTGGIVTETVENINAGEAPTYQLIYDWGYTSGTIVPAFTPIILKGKSGIYVYEICDKDGIVLNGDNLLHGTLKEEATNASGLADENYYFYLLTYSWNDVTNCRDLGFWWGQEDGSSFLNAPNKAFLALPKERNYSANSFKFSGPTTSVDKAHYECKSKITEVYTLAGRLLLKAENIKESIKDLNPGLYLINGQKVLVR